MAVRLFRIGWAIAALLLFAARQRLRPQAEVSIADRLRATLEQLGPTFVKLGQALSLRRDVLPDEYVSALHQLQDHVAPFPAALARRDLERELGRPVEAMFGDFENAPLAAASEVLVDLYLHQFFVVGLFHGDPHPGNLFVMADGRICFHDLGLVGFLDRPTRRALAMFLQAFVHQDAGWTLDAAIELGILRGDMDRVEFQRGIEQVLADYAALPLKDWSLAEAMLRVARLGRGENFLLPRISSCSCARCSSWRACCAASTRSSGSSTRSSPAAPRRSSPWPGRRRAPPRWTA